MEKISTSIGQNRNFHSYVTITRHSGTDYPRREAAKLSIESYTLTLLQIWGRTENAR